jgi:hypothetical protein
MTIIKLRLGLALLVTSLTGLYAYDVEKIPKVIKEIPIGQTPDQGLVRAVEEMSKQDDLFLNWAVLLLAASLGLLIAREPLRVRGVSWAYALFAGPPAVLLFASAWTGWKFKARLTFLLANNLDDWQSLNSLLSAQIHLFLAALLLLSLLGAWIVVERITRPLTNPRRPR